VTFADFQKALPDGAIPSVFVFHGEEPFLARLAVELLKKRVLAPGGEAFDFVSLTGRETTAETIASQTATAPMLSERRLTVVYEFEDMSPRERSKLAAYVASPVPGTCLALVSYGRLSAKSKSERDILSSAAVVDCGRPSRGALEALVSRMAEERGATIDEEARAVLIEWTEGDLNRISNELGKLACFVEEGRALGLADVEAVVGVRASGLKDLALAIARRSAGEALSLLAELTDARLVSQLYQLWIALWSARIGARAPGVAAGGRHLLGSGSDLARLARARTSREYARGVEAFYRADTDIRRGLPPGPTVGLLVYELAGGSPGDAA
jgi:DNA polymerase III delta subunit